MDLSVNMLCFTASYLVALALELAGLWTRPRWRRLAVVLAATAGILAHTWYLGQRAVLWATAPLSSPHDWYLAAAWALALIYVALVLYQPKASTGVFLLPVMLGLIAAARFASHDAIASFEAPRFWGMVHGVFLMLGSVAVLLGFVAGVMYLVESYRLKKKLPSGARFALPSLEWLERVNTRSLGAAALLVAVGFFTGIITRLATAGGAGVPWTDPVVVSLSGMLSWLVAAEAFRLAYPAARRGRKVAYLTLAGFVFLLFTLAAFMRADGVHGPEREARAARPEASERTAPATASGNAESRRAPPASPPDGGSP
ncbi:MAG TPA: cytochrome c biogenesis protein CcsA [Lacipirellulaceae bacterium]|nr:cytochrome c biogenesis protein CcsA [Lacipirellulaceae bacterium]